MNMNEEVGRKVLPKNEVEEAIVQLNLIFQEANLASADSGELSDIRRLIDSVTQNKQDPKEAVRVARSILDGKQTINERRY